MRSIRITNSAVAAMLAVGIAYTGLAAYVAHTVNTEVAADAAAEIETKSKEAFNQAQNLEATIITNLRHLHGIAAIIASDPSVMALASNIDQASDQISEKLATFAAKANVGVIWVLNSDGLCVSSSNAGKPESFVGTNYRDRGYFKQARDGKPGYQYAVGRKSNIPGLFFSAPIKSQDGSFAGAVIVKIDLPTVSWVDQLSGFVSDDKGVVILSHDKDMELKAMPGATIAWLPKAERQALYKKVDFETLHYERSPAWGKGSVVELRSSSTFAAVASTTLPMYGLQVTTFRPLDVPTNYQSHLTRGYLEKGITHSLAFFASVFFIAFTRAKIQANKAYKRMAFQDALTKLPNRRLLLDRMAQAIKRSRRTKQFGAVAFIDLDGFKSVNDRCGHEAGDDLLITVADRLRASVREVDTVARLGGDEFVVLLERLGEDFQEAKQNALIVANKLAESLRAPHHLTTTEGERVEFICSGSIGVTNFDGCATIDNICAVSDQAMYQVKRNGKNAVTWFPLDDPALEPTAPLPLAGA